MILFRKPVPTFWDHALSSRSLGRHLRESGRASNPGAERKVHRPIEPMARSARVARTVPALRRALAPWRSAGERIALIPTMGALHAGHLALVRAARRRARRLVVSIFVNPTQFAPQEDFASYPRTFERDLGALA